MNYWKKKKMISRVVSKPSSTSKDAIILTMGLKNVKSGISMKRLQI